VAHGEGGGHGGADAVFRHLSPRLRVQVTPVATQFLARIDPGSGAGFRKRKAGANCYYLTGYTSFPDTRAVAEDQ
jgi:hypothetical protein